MKARIGHIHPECNTGKIVALDELQKVYRSEVQKCVDEMFLKHRYHVKPSEMKGFFPSSMMSCHLRISSEFQAIHLVNAWVRGLYSRMKKRIFEQDFTDQQRMELRCIGKYLLTKAGKFGKGTISQEMLDLYWSWVWDEKISGARPIVSDDFPMWLNAFGVSFGKAKKAESLSGWWVKVSSLKNGKRVQIPLACNPFLDKPETFVSSVLIRKREGKWTFQFTDKTPDRKFGKTSKKLGLDVGLNVLAATSDGELFGQKVKPVFDRKYQTVQGIRANRFRQGFKTDSKRLHRLEQRLTGFVKTEIGTVVNTLVKKHPDTTFVIENLDLRGCRGQKRFAYKFLHRSLRGKAPTQEVNPAYSSQECPSCGYISRNNRDGVKFHCRCCGRISHADVVGAVNLLGRSEDKQITVETHYKQVGIMLRERFRRSRTSSSTLRRKRRIVRPDAYCDESRIASNAVIGVTL